MSVETAKVAVKALTELAEAKKDAAEAMVDTRQHAAHTAKLWREGNKSTLIKIGVALVVFPEPTPISELIGAGFIAAGAVQKAIQNRSIYIEDIAKTLKSTLRELADVKNEL